uniref:Tetraspanin n=1 Tax=Macrostomum lignano TaxID=282301 RepID=A0A1I8IPQ4_9PLAT
MPSSLLICSNNVCTVFLVVVNVLAMMLSLLLLLLGVLLVWGYQLLVALYPPALSVADGLSQQLNSALGSSDIDARQLLSNLASLTMPAGAACLALGLVAMVTACFGCCPVCCCRKKRKKPLIAVRQWAKAGMEYTLTKFTGIDCSNLESLLINLMQIFVGCCGVTNGTDFYSLSSNWNREYTLKTSSGNFTYNITYPITCCKFNLTSMEQIDNYCSYNNTNSVTSWYQTGCHDKLITKLESMLNFKAFVIGIVCILLTELLLVLGAAIILRSPKSGKLGKVAPSPAAPSTQ